MAIAGDQGFSATTRRVGSALDALVDVAHCGTALGKELFASGEWVFGADVEGFSVAVVAKACIPTTGLVGPASLSKRTGAIGRAGGAVFAFGSLALAVSTGVGGGALSVDACSGARTGTIARTGGAILVEGAFTQAIATTWFAGPILAISAAGALAIAGAVAAIFPQGGFTSPVTAALAGPVGA